MTIASSRFSVRTEVINGAGVRSMLPELLRGLGAKRAVLFTDQGLNRAGLTEKITELFQEIPGSVQLVGVFDEIEQDAKAENINKAAQFMKECQADALIALGGGSVLDACKATKWLLHKNHHDIRDLMQGSTRETWPQVQPISIPHIAIPTTAGTGSEVSPIAVVYNDLLQIKTNLSSPFISADIALLDPELTVGLPPRITAFTGYDALTHAVEAYFSPRANPMTDAFALHATKIVVENLPKAVSTGTDLQARSNMLMASSMAITSFSLAITAIPVHNMAHAFGAKFGIPHGLANAVLLPNVMAALPHLYLPRINGFAEALGLSAHGVEPEACLQQVIAFIRELRSNIGLPDTFAEFGLDEKSIADMVPAVLSDPTALAFKIPPDTIVQICQEVAGTPLSVQEESSR
ncbi:iron-containing alcohol dehydrogenase [Brevibacillus nitrificans]|uniref:iron-containing alcohol dehydrogenase n=1 Tax=Brevibacillus nitrificans TaxID=651560 RepID=UPI00285E6E71|nr:iron-containing alcohol dehydrogenase [Brevibacillus nitrificans]MDR7317918.1 alcohol dehydrogenase class IV [Brevibacillus nitrificans]